MFSGLLNSHKTYDTCPEKQIEPTNEKNDGGHHINRDEVDQLIKTFHISKFESPCPIYACITPLRMLLKCRQDMAKETLNLQDGKNTKDDVDVSMICGNNVTTTTNTKNMIIAVVVKT